MDKKALCPKCHSDQVNSEGPDARTGYKRYRCKECGKYFNENTAYYNGKTVEHKPSVPRTRGMGMSLSEFRAKHDVDFIVQNVLDSLDPEKVYEKSEVVQLTGLRAGYPGLSAAIENASEYKGRAGGNSFWSHPDTIRQLKKETLMT